MLVERPIGCMTYLEAGEIIMNYGVREERVREGFEGIALAYFSKDGARKSDGTYDPGEELNVRLHVPDKVLLSSPTIEYVAEVAWHDEVNDPPPGGASFVSASSGCDGRRAHGTTRKVRMLSLKMPEDGRDVAIFAAWATEHEAVSLTEEIILRAKGGPEGAAAGANVGAGAIAIADTDASKVISKDNSKENIENDKRHPEKNSDAGEDSDIEKELNLGRHTKILEKNTEAKEDIGAAHDAREGHTKMPEIRVRDIGVAHDAREGHTKMPEKRVKNLRRHVKMTRDKLSSTKLLHHMKKTREKLSSASSSGFSMKFFLFLCAVFISLTAALLNRLKKRNEKIKRSV